MRTLHLTPWPGIVKLTRRVTESVDDRPDTQLPRLPIPA